MEEHKQKGLVLENRGYKGMGHTCNSQCKKDYDCVRSKLQGKHPAPCPSPPAVPVPPWRTN